MNDPENILAATSDPRDIASKPVHIAGAGTLAMTLLLVSLTILFGASIGLYLVIRYRFSMHVEVAPPQTLWISTVLILASSATVQWALWSIRRNHEKAMTRALGATLGLGLAFLVCQVFNWLELARGFSRASRLFLSRENALAVPHPHHSAVAMTHFLYASFYAFTILHAAHVLGGLVPLAIVARNARRGKYSANFHPGVRHVTMYWHFLDIVWLVLFAVIMVTI